MPTAAAMASTLALPPHVLKNLGDKLYDKRKAGALDIEQVRRQMRWHGLASPGQRGGGC